MGDQLSLLLYMSVVSVESSHYLARQRIAGPWGVHDIVMICRSVSIPVCVRMCRSDCHHFLSHIIPYANFCYIAITAFYITAQQNSPGFLLISFASMYNGRSAN